MSPTKALAIQNTGPLAGVRVVDLTSVVFGAYATQMLGDMGADVIKIETPAGPKGGGGDVMRWAGHPPEGAPAELGPIFMTINRNKRSMLLDLRKGEDAEALRRLIATADVFAASVRYDGLKRLGFDYDGVKAIRPDIVYAHGAGYGSAGPYAGEPAYDDLIQSACGLADLLPRADGDPRPRLIPALIADKVSGLFMTQAICAALYHRQRTGEGQFVEVPMLECLTSFTLAEHFYGHVYDPPTGPWAYTRIANPERKPFPTKDGSYRPDALHRSTVGPVLRGGGPRRDLRQGPALFRLQDPRPPCARTLRPRRDGDAEPHHGRMAGACSSRSKFR